MIFSLNNEVKNYVLNLSNQAETNSRIYPVDREFLEPFLEKILSMDSVEFIFYNIELDDMLYPIQVLACLPEIWQVITLDNLLEMSQYFTKPMSYYTLIKFTYKYIEIDIIDEIMKSKHVQNSPYYLHNIIEYLNTQWNVLFKTKQDLEDFTNGFIHVDYKEWIFVKQKFLIDKRVSPATTDYDSTYNRIMRERNW